MSFKIILLFYFVNLNIIYFDKKNLNQIKTFQNKDNFNENFEIIEELINTLDLETKEIENYFIHYQKSYKILKEFYEENKEVFIDAALFSFLGFLNQIISDFDSDLKDKLIFEYINNNEEKNYFDINKEEESYENFKDQLSDLMDENQITLNQRLIKFLEIREKLNDLSMEEQDLIKFFFLKSHDLLIKKAQNLKLFFQNYSSYLEFYTKLNNKFNIKSKLTYFKNDNKIDNIDNVIQNNKKYIDNLNKLKDLVKIDNKNKENYFNILKKFKNQNIKLFEKHFLVYSLINFSHSIYYLKLDTKNLIIYDYIYKNKVEYLFDLKLNKDSYNNFINKWEILQNEYDRKLNFEFKKYINEKNLNFNELEENMDDFLLFEIFDKRIQTIKNNIDFIENYQNN